MRVSPTMADALVAIADQEDRSASRSDGARIAWVEKFGTRATFRALVARNLIEFTVSSHKGSRLRRRRFGRGYDGAETITITTHWVRLTEEGRRCAEAWRFHWRFHKGECP